MPRAKIHVAGRRVPLLLSVFLALVISTSLVPQSGTILAHAETTTWARTYGDSAPTLVQLTSDGGYVVAGDFHVFKFDADGNVEWGRNFGGLNAHSLQQTSDGEYILLGNDLVKLDAAGNIEWVKSTFFGLVGSVKHTPDDGYVLASHVPGDNEEGKAVWVVKFDSNAIIEWQKRYDILGSLDEAKSVQLTSDGGYIVAGATESSTAKTSDIWILKLDSDGNIEWEKAYGGTDWELASSVFQTPDGGYIVGVEYSMAMTPRLSGS